MMVVYKSIKERLVAEIIDHMIEVEFNLTWLRELLRDGFVGYENMTEIQLQNQLDSLGYEVVNISSSVKTTNDRKAA